MALDFEGGRFSSDASLVLLTDIDAQLGLTRALAAVLSDPRETHRLHLTPEDLLKQRVCQSAAGYEDANDAHTLRDDPICTLLLDRLPAPSAPLASQPTLSRFAHRIARPALSRLALVLLKQCIASYASPPPVIVLDVDDPEAPVHGAQEQARYDGSDGGYGFMPLHRYAGLAGRLITTIVKATRFTGTQMLAVLQRLVTHLRHAWPDTLGIWRGDSPCASPEGMPWIDKQPDLHDVTGLPSKAVVKARAREVVEQAQRAYASSRRQVTRLHSTRYQAPTWARARRVVINVEVSEQGVTPRFVVTAMEQVRPPVLAQHLDCARGQAENDIQAHKLYLQSDRTACHRFEAKQFRLLLHSAAYVLLETLRRKVLRTTQWASATRETIQ